MTETLRNVDLRRMLTARRQQMRDDVLSRIRHGRSDQPEDVRDSVDMSDADVQRDIELAMLQMRVEALSAIDAALFRLDAGDYGSCVDCRGQIAERRLRALPFAVRCQACEERREHAQGRARQHAQQSGGFSQFPESIAS